MKELETPITTQEALDEIIGERLKRDRETQAKKYADYDSVKSELATSKETIASLTKSINDDKEKYANYDSTLKELQGKVAKYETDSVKTRIAFETGLPYGMAGRLAGTTEDEIKKDAESLKAMMGGQTKQNRAPGKTSNDDIGTDSKNAQFRELLNNLKF